MKNNTKNDGTVLSFLYAYLHKFNVALKRRLKVLNMQQMKELNLPYISFGKMHVRMSQNTNSVSVVPFYTHRLFQTK
ncbi:hypothetical protein J2S17_001469 [Cytobacillus purgationiresistens]|uniref:Uncharacterized protein n=1 Tax=Cytobacillus purgationiresistens TaxID=863449 RepID=A0ABU0AEC3_9BACI|nr:hypothetical protein [Cytobacillus purgationiresistens]